MKQHLSKLACATLLGAAIAGSSFTGAAQAQTAGSLAIPFVTTTTAEAAIEAEPIHYRKRRYYRRYDDRSGVYFNFGNGSFSLTVPPRRYYPRYRRHYDGYQRDSYSRHVRWCYSRYKSYRHWDNTFQPYHGPRRQCWSPYN